MATSVLTDRSVAAVTFFVPGDPRPQGNHRTSRHGYIYDSTKGLPSWRKAVADYARLEVRATGRVFHGPCALTVMFLIRKPPRCKLPYPTRRMDGDWDKLARPAGDSLVDGGLLLDDKLIVRASVGKDWGATPGARITLRDIEAVTRAELEGVAHAG